MTDSPYRQRCGHCCERPPVQVIGEWIDFCQRCYDDWLVRNGE